MGKNFQKFVKWFGDCKYVPVGTRCSICGKKLNFFTTGFWSVNIERYNRHLSDGVLCAKCKEKAEYFIKSRKKWMSKELQAMDEWKKFDGRNMDYYSVSDIKMLMEQKELSDKENISAYDKRGTGLFGIQNSFGLGINVFMVGIFRYKKLKDKTVVFGISEENAFQKGDRVKVYVADLEFETTVLEAHRLDKDGINGRDMDTVFFETLGANLKWNRKIKENQKGWLILDIAWKYKLNGGRVVKID